MNKILSCNIFLPIFLVATTLFIGCQNKDEKIKEYADIQSEVSARNGFIAEQNYLDTRAKAMEIDLEKRQRFYQAISGTYEGKLEVNRSEFNIRVTLTPSLPRYIPNDRIRTPEEVAADLNGLYINVQVVQWNPENNLGSVGCLVTNVRPDIIKGRINVVSEGCANFFRFNLADDVDNPTLTGTNTPGEVSAALATELTEGRLDSISQLNGKVQLTTNASVYKFSATRVEE